MLSSQPSHENNLTPLAGINDKCYLQSWDNRDQQHIEDKSPRKSPRIITESVDFVPQRIKKNSQIKKNLRSKSRSLSRGSRESKGSRSSGSIKIVMNLKNLPPPTYKKTFITPLRGAIINVPIENSK